MSKLDFSVDKIETTDNKKDSIDNLQDAQSYTSLKGLQDLFKYIYPVNSIYISYSHTYPGDLFGGTWERIEKFLWCTDETGNIGVTGGEYTHKLTVDEMPGHSHNSFISTDNGRYYGAWPDGGGWLGQVLVGWGNTIKENVLFSAGGNQPHNNMPPFTQVSAWRRTEL